MLSMYFVLCMHICVHDSYMFVQVLYVLTVRKVFHLVILLIIYNIFVHQCPNTFIDAMVL